MQIMELTIFSQNLLYSYVADSSDWYNPSHLSQKPLSYSPKANLSLSSITTISYVSLSLSSLLWCFCSGLVSPPWAPAITSLSFSATSFIILYPFFLHYSQCNVMMVLRLIKSLS